MSSASDNVDKLQAFAITATSSDARDNVEKLRYWPFGTIVFLGTDNFRISFTNLMLTVVDSTPTPLLSYTIV